MNNFYNSLIIITLIAQLSSPSWAQERSWLDDLFKNTVDTEKLSAIAWDKFEQLLEGELEDPNLPKVVGLPPDYSSPPFLEPYRGPHPSRIQRPAEHFPFPIRLGEVGPVHPLFAGPLEYPFLCGTEESGLGQPWVDNQQQSGIPIYALDEQGHKTQTIIGYSQDCLLPTRAYYYYNRVGTHDFFPLDQANQDIATLDWNGQTVEFIVRVEIGTINRFLYSIAALKAPGETLEQPRPDHWNGRLIYKFRGGVGIGKRQGALSPTETLTDSYEQLRQGHAVIYSTANRTAIHYDIGLAEDTALRVKRQFTSLYGNPLYTVGIGGSGGAIQQYLLAQNNPGLLDGIIAIYSFPDMVTQTIAGLDCELLEYYFDVTAADNQKWHDWGNRQWIEGLNAITGVESDLAEYYALARLLGGHEPMWPGMSECVNGWRGLTPLAHNPNTVHFFSRFEPAVLEKVHWTHWDNLKSVYGTNEWGYARNTWDNVGVQYGLEAVLFGRITPEEFLDLNARIGGWKQPHEMEQERYGGILGERDTKISLWGNHNMHQSPDGGITPAPRTEGDLAAMEAAYRSGNVFIGRLQHPIIDMRHYLEPELDMHHLSASFSARARLIREQGHADNQLIWITRQPHILISEAFALMDRWLLNMRQNPELGVVGNKPPEAMDQCFDSEGRLLAQGPTVWNGPWNHHYEPGECTRIYPHFTQSRAVAGDQISGSIFKCHLISVEEAIDRGFYIITDHAFFAPYIERLHAIFPHGVCDYTQPDQGRPVDL